MRFLEDPNGKLVETYNQHSFDYTINNEKKKYWKNCINTFGYDQNCPICKKVSEYYKSPYKEDKDLGGERGRKVNYVSNVYIEENKNAPETVGKVFLYRFGKKIYEKLDNRMYPKDSAFDDPDFKAFTPHDVYEGARFKLKVKSQGEFPNYDDSEFSAQSEFLGGDDDKIGAALEKCFSLDEFIDPTAYPSNETVIKEIGFLIGLGPMPEPSGGTFTPKDIPKTQEKKEEKKEEDIPFFDGASTTPPEDVDPDQAFFDKFKK